MLSELIEEFVVWLKRERLAQESTIETWRPALRFFLTWARQDVKGEPVLAHFTKDRLLDFRDYLYRQRGLRPRSVRRYLASLRSFNTWLIEEKHMMSENVAKLINVGKMDAAVRPQVTDDEVIQMLAAAKRIENDRDRCLARALLSVFAYAGLRRQEALNLKVRDIQPDGRIQVDKGKGGKNRSIYPSLECITAIREYLAVRPTNPGPYLFVYDRARRLHHKKLNQILRQCRRIADLEDHVNIKPHPLRRNNGQYLLKNGYSIDDVREHYGHSSIRTTEEYLMVPELRLKELRERGNRVKESADPSPAQPPAPASPAVPFVPTVTPEMMQQIMQSFPFFAAMFAAFNSPKPDN